MQAITRRLGSQSSTSLKSIYPISHHYYGADHERHVSTVATKGVGHLVRKGTGGRSSVRLRAFSTEVSLDKESVTSEILKEFRATIENAPAASSAKVCGAYIDKICKAGNIFALNQMLQMLNDKNIVVSSNVCNLVLVEAIQNNDIDLSFQVLKKLLLSGESPSAISCNKFAQAFRNVNHSVELLRFLKEIVSETGCSSISSFINKITFAFAKSGQKDSALMIFGLLKRQNDSVLDLITYNIVLDILGRMGQVDEMLDEFASLKKAGFVPDIISYNTLIHGLGKVGRSDMCFVYFEEMKENGNQPNLLTYTALIDTFGRAGNIEESLKLFREMKLKGILPSIQIYRSLIHNLTKIDKIELATELLGEMNSSSTVLPGPRDLFSDPQQLPVYLYQLEHRKAYHDSDGACSSSH